MSVRIETARHEWEEGFRRLQAARSDPARYEPLSAQVEAVTGELRRRLGQIFTLDELADEYQRAELWRRDVLSDTVQPARSGDLSTAEDAAFYLYARGARDYAP